MELSEPEWLALCRIVKDHARMTGEDVTGSILRTSGHQLLNGEGIVALAAKIEHTKEAPRG